MATSGWFDDGLIPEGWFDETQQADGWFDGDLLDVAAIDVRVSWVQFEVPAASGVAGTMLKYWTGAAWSAKPLKKWNGSAWVPATLKRWNGSAWVTA